MTTHPTPAYTPPTAPATVSLDELARLVGVSRRQAWALSGRADFPPRRMLTAHRGVWLRAEVLAWLHSLPATPVRPEPAHLKARREAAGVSREHA